MTIIAIRKSEWGKITKDDCCVGWWYL